MVLGRFKCSSLLQHRGLTITQLKQIHAQTIINGINCREGVSLLGKLVEYLCTGSDREGVNYARRVVNYSNDSNPFLFNVLIRSVAPDEAIRLFGDRIRECDLVFDEFTYIFVLGACARSLCTSSALRMGRQVHNRVLKIGFGSNVMVKTTGVHFYAKTKEFVSARRLFDEMPVRSAATWNAMISGYCTEGTSVTSNAREALVLFGEMLYEDCGVRPTATTMVGVLTACSRLGILAMGSCVHGYIIKGVCVPENDVFIGTGLVDMYSKCGCIGGASQVFQAMTTKNVLTWTAMIAGLALHGLGNEAMELVTAMEVANLRPNEVTFTSLLLACCHTGLVEEGLYLFKNMSEKFGIAPTIKHYGCIVDLLGRAGRLKEAYEFIVGMPIEVDDILWRSLLAACNIHGDAVMGEKVGKLLLERKSEGRSSRLTTKCEDFIALSNVYASAERWEDVEVVRGLMKVEGIQTNPGRSFIESN